jgi:anti-sigma B factor antagonist
MILQLHKTQPSPDLCRIEFVGKLMMGNDSRQVEWSLAELLVAGVKKVVFDLSKLETIDSTGVGIIVVCHARLQKAGGSLRVAAAQGIVLETLHMTHVDRLVQIFPSADAAEQNFAAAGSAGAT